MFGENRDVPAEEIGVQKEWDAKRAVLVTRNLQASEGIFQEPNVHPRPGDKRPASPPHDSPTTQQRERKGAGRESSRVGDRDTRQGKGAGKKGERLTSEGSIPGGRSSWDDYHGHPKSRPERPRGRGDERERLPRHGDDDLLRRSRSTREAATRVGVRLTEAPSTRPTATPGDVSSTGTRLLRPSATSPLRLVEEERWVHERMSRRASPVALRRERERGGDRVNVIDPDDAPEGETMTKNST